MLIKSIRWRIQSWHTLLLGIIVATLFIAFYRHEREILYKDLDRDLKRPMTGLLPLFDRPPSPRRAGGPRRGPGPRGRPGRRGERDLPRGFSEGPDREEPEGRREERREDQEARVTSVEETGAYLVVISRDDESVYASDHAPEFTPPERSERSRENAGYTTRTVGSNREVVHIGRRGTVIAIGQSTDDIEKTLQELVWKLTGIGSAIIVGGFVIGSLLMARSLRPIRRIADTAEEIAHGDLSRRIDPGETDSELGKVIGILNHTFNELETSFGQQIRFTADASHEMRTPIAVILAKSQFALSKERPPEKYREALTTCMESAQHMRELIDSLLQLARIDSGELTLEKEEVDFANLVEESLHLVEPLAGEREIEITSELSSTTASLDSSRIRQVLINLLSNAIKYNLEGGKVHVALKSDNNHHILTVADTGLGMREEDLPHLFERFYRIDKARTVGSSSSTGLGLAISRAIIEAHGGSIGAESQVGKGTTFTLSLPVSD